jgi:phosphatidylglycerophosphate synthase
MTPEVVVRPAADLATGLAALGDSAGAGAGPLLLVPSDLHVHPEALADLADDPRPGTAVLAGRAPAGTADLRVRAGRVVAVATPAHLAHRCDTTFTGAVRVGAADRETVARLAGELAALARERSWSGDPTAYLVLGLVRSGVRVGAVLLDPWPWARGEDEATRDLQSRLDAMDPAAVHAVRFRRASKAEDAFVATFVHRPVARRLTPVALRLGLTPNQVTLLSVVVGLAAAASFAVGSAPALVAGALLLQLSLVLDCVDGDVARYRRMFSPVGAWLDASTDRLKEFACYGGLAWGADAGRTGWLLAAAMLTLQTARHASDYTFTAAKELREGEPVTAALDDPHDPAGSTTAGADVAAAPRAVALSRRASAGRPAVVWLKKVLHLGIGERWAVLSVFALVGLPGVGLAVLLVLGLGSLLYVGAGRTLRARAWPAGPVSPREHEIVRAQVDGAPLVPAAVEDRVAGGPDGHQRFLWVRPALLRVVEYAAVLGLTAVLPGESAGAAAFALLLVVASHHYDGLYRVLQGLGPPGPVTRVLGLGAVGRVLVVAVLAAVGTAEAGAGEGGVWLLAAGLGILFLGTEPARMLREVRSRTDLATAADPTEGAAGA